MTTDQRIARRKLSLLELAQDLGNVSRACKLVGYSRQQFYEIRRNYQTFGAAGLIDKVKASDGNVLVVGHSNTVPEIIKSLGVSEPVAIPDDQFDNLFVVIRGARPTLLRLHYR